MKIVFGIIPYDIYDPPNIEKSSRCTFEGENLEIKWSPKDQTYVVLSEGELVGAVSRSIVRWFFKAGSDV